MTAVLPEMLSKHTGRTQPVPKHGVAAADHPSWLRSGGCSPLNTKTLARHGTNDTTQSRSDGGGLWHAKLLEPSVAKRVRARGGTLQGPPGDPTRRCRRTKASVALLPLAFAAERPYRWPDTLMPTQQTEVDFEKLSWHDCHIWRLDLQVGDPDEDD